LQAFANESYRFFCYTSSTCDCEHALNVHELRPAHLARKSFTKNNNTSKTFSYVEVYKEFSGQEIRSSVVFNPLEGSSVAVEEEDSELKGAVIDRRCSRCNKEGMVYHTRQMRSADEGQTVFFTCMHCRYQEKEDS
uniref:DNA-directed RNA polymerase I subunit RPA12 n=1 Tax=Salmo trutta TaxID=8032 RepID=A0A673YQ41_SALTR